MFGHVVRIHYFCAAKSKAGTQARFIFTAGTQARH